MSLFPEILLLQVGKYYPKRQIHPILKPSASATSLVHMSGKFTFSSEMQKKNTEVEHSHGTCCGAREGAHFNSDIATVSAAVGLHGEEKNFHGISAVWGASGNI